MMIYGVEMTDRRREILTEALALADERGLAAVSMRAVAQRVGVTPMALYPHVGSKQDMLDGLVELLVTDLPMPAAELPWPERFAGFARAARQSARRHPTAFALLFDRPAVTADSLLVIDFLYQLLLDAGVPRTEIARAERMLSTFVLGFAVSEQGGRFAGGSLPAPARRAQLPADDLPAHHGLAAELDQPLDLDAEFDADVADLVAFIEHVLAAPH
jgi:AcrR family transcriptional regulator